MVAGNGPIENPTCFDMVTAATARSIFRVPKSAEQRASTALLTYISDQLSISTALS